MSIAVKSANAAGTTATSVTVMTRTTWLESGGGGESANSPAAANETCIGSTVQIGGEFMFEKPPNTSENPLRLSINTQPLTFGATYIPESAPAPYSSLNKR
jgi:hypothetical protein